MNPVCVLVGAPGAGKSTVGQALAAALGKPFDDTDSIIEKSAGKPRAFRIGDGIDVFEGERGAGEDVTSKGQQTPDMVAGRKLGDDAPVVGMHGHLRVECVTEQTSRRVIERDARLVAGCFDAQDHHEKCRRKKREGHELRVTRRHPWQERFVRWLEG